MDSTNIEVGKKLRWLGYKDFAHNLPEINREDRCKGHIGVVVMVDNDLELLELQFSDETLMADFNEVELP